jgi:NADPH-dependent glutamate synthase beta subunit-like oxidoreductase
MQSPGNIAAPRSEQQSLGRSDHAVPNRVVVIGAGFAGLNAAKALSRMPVALTIIDQRNHHLFQPLLYQVATAGLSPADIATPIRSMFSGRRNVRVLLGQVTGVDTRSREVLLDDKRVPYDALIIATGARHAYFGHDNWEPFAPGLKQIEDATAIRRRILIAFEQAEAEEDAEERRRLLTFAVIGAGPTGWNSPAPSPNWPRSHWRKTSAPSIRATRGLCSSRLATAYCPRSRLHCRTPRGAPS